MELKKEIKSLVENKGSRFILYPQFINILTDYQAFADNQASKYVLKTFIEEGYVEKLISLEENQLPIGDIALRYFNELYSKYGFRRDVSLLVVNAILFALNIEEISYSYQDDDNEEGKTSNNASTHIVFSGISLDHSLKEIEKHLQGRGFVTKRSNPIQIEMWGELCEHTATLFINGSQLGVTKNIVVQYKQGLEAIIGKMIYDLLIQKYGRPNSSYDPLDLIYWGSEGVAKNISEIVRRKEEMEDIFNFTWAVKGGEINLYWLDKNLTLVYMDIANTQAAESYQEKFNSDSL